MVVLHSDLFLLNSAVFLCNFVSFVVNDFHLAILPSDFG